jgi:hypothetical protein
MQPIRVLVPDEEGVQALAGSTVMVTGVLDVEPEIAFMRGLPHLRLLQTLNAGFDQWVGRLPPGVALSNGRGAHGRVRHRAISSSFR